MEATAPLPKRTQPHATSECFAVCIYSSTNLISEINLTIDILSVYPSNL